jgi:Coenzyme PQQ synthesis protein D (PqqD)
MSRGGGTPVHSLSCASVVERRDGFIEAQVDGELVALNIERGTCYALNRVGSRIWDLLREPSRIGDLCTKLLSEYRVAPDVCERDVLEVLEELRAEGLIATAEEK